MQEDQQKEPSTAEVLNEELKDIFSNVPQDLKSRVFAEKERTQISRSKFTNAELKSLIIKSLVVSSELYAKSLKTISKIEKEMKALRQSDFWVK